MMTWSVRYFSQSLRGAGDDERAEVSRLLVGDFNSLQGSTICENGCPEVSGVSAATARLMRWMMRIDHAFVRGVIGEARRGFGIDEGGQAVRRSARLKSGVSDGRPKR